MKREESALDRAKSDLVRDFIAQHLPNEKIIAVENIIIKNGLQNGELKSHNNLKNGHHINGHVESSINAK